MKKITTVCIVFILLIGTFTFSFAQTATENVSSVKTSNKNSEQVISEYIEAINNKDVDTIVSLSPKEESEEWIELFSNQDKEELGFRSIKNAAIVTIEPVEEDILAQNTNLEYYYQKFGGTIQGYLVGTEINVIKDNRYFHNGLNFHLVIVATEDGQKKIVEFSEASLLLLNSKINTFKVENNLDLQSVIRYKEAKSKGLILDSKGNVIETNIASEEQLQEERGNNPVQTKGINLP